MVAISIDVRISKQQLTHRYCFYNDTMQPAKVVDLFTPDGVMDETQIGLPRAAGAQLGQYFKEGGPRKYMVHYVTNQIIQEFSGNTANGLCVVLGEAILRGGGRVKIVGYYDDQYAKIDGEWRFRSRNVVPLMPPDLGNYYETDHSAVTP